MIMHTEYAKEADEDILFYEQSDRPSDIPLPAGVSTLLLAIWLVICLIGFTVIFLAKMPFIGIVIIAIPTFIGMIIKPTFALCIMMLVLPTGAGIGYGQAFSLDRGVGIAVAVSFLLNLMISRPSLHIRNKALWVAIPYTIWIFFSTLTAPHVSLEVRRSFTQFQLLALVFIVYWILQTNSEKTFRWALRAYVIGTLGSITIAHISGAAMISVEEKLGRYTATAGQMIDPNMLSVLISMGFLAAIYLFARDKRIFWRIIYLIAIALLPIMVLRTGSRGGLIALVFTILSPLLFVKQVLRRPALAALLLLVIVFASGSAAFFIQKYSLEKRVSERLTDVQYAKMGIDYRIDLIKKAIEAATKYPTGTSYLGWSERTGIFHHPHDDFFFALGVYGIPAAMLFMLFVIMLMFTIRRMPLGLEKLYARAVLTLLLVMGLNIGQLYQKHFWIFIAFVMASERIAKLYTTTSDLETTVQYEEYSSMQHELV
jgi:O-antigen ligase